MRSLATAAVFAAAVLLSATPSLADETWSATGELKQGRYLPGSALLPDGKVLEFGGMYRNESASGIYPWYTSVNPGFWKWTPLASSEIYDPATRAWTMAGEMKTARWDPASVVLSDGRILVAGGGDSTGAILATAEIYDPRTGVWTLTGSMKEPRHANMAVLLPSGKVLVAGGVKTNIWDGWDAPTDTAEIYDPVAETWSYTGTMHQAAWGRRLVLLADGLVLGIGGAVPYAMPVSEIYDPATETWSAEGTFSWRKHFTATRLLDGTVLSVGGTAFGYGFPMTMRRDPSSGSWTDSGSISLSPSSGHTATLLPSGDVLVTGGEGYGSPQPAYSDVFNVATGTWHAGPVPLEVDGRFGHTATLLPDGTVLIAGGLGDPHDGRGWREIPRCEILGTPVPPNHPPVASAGADQTVEATSAGSTSITLDGSASSDPDGDALTYAWTGDFGTAAGVSPAVSLALGVHTISLTVTDTHGASAMDTVVITVQDTTAPTITTLTATPNVLGPPNHKMVAVSLTGTATDACDAAPTLEIASVTSNEPTEGLGDGDTPIDWVVTGAMTLNLRAERSGKGTGRIYTITVRATDTSGNSALKAVTATVPKSSDEDGCKKGDDKGKDDDKEKKDSKDKDDDKGKKDDKDSKKDDDKGGKKGK